MIDKKMQLFEDKRIRTAWDEEAQDWYFSIVDAVAVLTSQATPRSASNYWAKLKERLIAEGAQLLTNCQQLKMTAVDGKKRLTDVATTEQLLHGNKRDGSSWKPTIPSIRKLVVLQRSVHFGEFQCLMKFHWYAMSQVFRRSCGA